MLREANRRFRGSLRGEVPGSGVSVVKLPAGLPVEEAVKRYESLPGVEYAEPDFLLKPAPQAVPPNDPNYTRLYGLNNTDQSGGSADAEIDSPEAWSTTTGDPGVVVAVIDEGVGIKHSDLANNIWTNLNEFGSGKETNGVDDDRNGYVDDVNGWDFANNDKSVYDPNPVTGDGDEHGTHVAGTIAARGNNSLGVTGVGWQTRVMPLKFLGVDGGFTSDAVETFNYVVAKGSRSATIHGAGAAFLKPSQTL